jgi:hypothetical protein
MNPSDFLSLLTGDLTKEEAKVVRHAGLRILWRAAMAIFVAYALGIFSVLGISGFASAQQVDQKLAPVAAQLARQSVAIDQLSKSAQEQTLAIMRAGIMDLQVKKCKAKTDESKAIYRNQQEEVQMRYHSITGDFLAVPACADL